MKKHLRLTAFLSTVLLAFVTISCSNDDDNTGIMEPEANIVETAQSVNDLSLLVDALEQADAGLVETLSGTGPFTVFAPTNNAFSELLNALGEDYNSLADFDTDAEKELLATVLTYHVVSGTAALSTDLTDGMSITTVQGETLTVDLTSGVFIEDATEDAAQVSTADVLASNGVVHIIDKVLLPQEVLDLLMEPEPGNSIVDLAMDSPELSSLVAALQAADLVDTLEGAGPFTVFAPTNAAFDAFLTDNGFDGLDAVPVDVLTQVLLNHVVAGENLSSGLTTSYISSSSTAGVDGKNLSLYIDTTSGVMINGVATVTDADLEASNGVVHIVDGVIGLPTIVDHAVANANLTELVGALTSGGNTTFTDLLSSSDEVFTVFAPVNAGFEAFTNPDGNELNNILSNHVIVGTAATSTDLTNMYVNTAATNTDGDFLSMYINTDSGVTLNGESNVAIADIVATNGIIHAVDMVIDLPTVVDLAIADSENFSSLVGALTAEGQPDFVSVLSTPNGTSPAPFTVFAPINSAFGELATVPTGADLTAVLNHHVIAENNIVSGDLSDGLESPATLEGDTLTFSISGEMVGVTDGSGNSDINIVLADVQAINGVIHAVDKVLLPNTAN
ncbi:MAG: fasciclin domain-containing protein [Sediminicola sp.]